MTEPVVYRAPPTLALFMRSNTKVRAVVGPIGSGKSSACCMELLRRAAEQRPHNGVRATRAVVIRNTYRELKDTTRKTFEAWIPPSLGKWHEQDFTFTIRQRLTDGTAIRCEVLFRALDKPEDVKKLLSLELTFAWINEARQVPKAILDMLGGRVSRYPAKKDGGPTWHGIWMDTNPWHTGHWGFQLFSKQRPEGHELFEQPGGREPNAENLENLVPGYYSEQIAGKDAEWVSEWVDAKYPSHDKGSIYGDVLALLDARGGIYDFEHATDSIFTAWDLGRTDSTAIWFFRYRRSTWGTQVEVVDHYENHGQALSHYFGVLEQKQQERGYRYAKHWLPHDARAMTLAAEVSILNQFINKYGTGAVAIGPELALLDGMAAARWLLEQDIRIHSRCDVPALPGFPSGLASLKGYHYEWNEKHLTFSRTPVHDLFSHSADAFRYLACAVKMSEALRPIEDERLSPRAVAAVPLTLDEMWEAKR